MGLSWLTLIIVTVMVVAYQVNFIGARVIGVCYGTLGDNLPPPNEVISLFQRSEIQLMRLYDPNPVILEALRGSNLAVSLGVRNEDIAALASNQEASNDWVRTNIVPYKDDVLFGWLTVGNEVIPGPIAPNVAPAMTNLQKALLSLEIRTIKVTTVVPSNVLSVSYPPSAGTFSSEVIGAMTEIATSLFHTGAPLMINVYPYFAYSSDPTNISLDYALFKSSQPIVVDGDLKYYNLFDAMVDAFYAALEKINLPNVTIAVSESGWPSAGNEPYTSIDNARTYNKNLMKRVAESGTPRRPDDLLDTFMFAMFNENLKPPGVEQNFGFFYPNMEPVYPFW